MSAENNGSLVKLNGNISQGENIGDNGGFKQSYRCALSMYIFYLKRHKNLGGGNLCFQRKKTLTPSPPGQIAVYSPVYFLQLIITYQKINEFS